MLIEYCKPIRCELKTSFEPESEQYCTEPGRDLRLNCDHLVGYQNLLLVNKKKMTTRLVV